VCDRCSREDTLTGPSHQVEYITERTRVEYNVAEDDKNEKEQLHKAARRVWKSTRDKINITPEREKKNLQQTRRHKRTQALGKKLVAVLTVPVRSIDNDD
jgi:hypothetical protein